MSFRVTMPDEFLTKLSKLNEKFDKIVPKVLEAGAKPLYQKANSNLISVLGKNTKYKSRSTGAVLTGLGITPPLQDGKGNWNIKIGFDDSKDSKGVSNALKANVLEYGKSGQPAKKWLGHATSAQKRVVIETMDRKFDEEVRSLWA